MSPIEGQASEQEIGARWRNSPKYQKYLELGGESSAEARALKEAVITEITREVLAIYIRTFDAKYQELMDRKVKELPLGLQVLLGDISIGLTEKLNPGYDITTKSKFNTLLFNYIDSIYKGKGLALKTLNDLVTKFPELNSSKIIEQLREIGKNSDDGAKRDIENQEWTKIGAQIRKM